MKAAISWFKNNEMVANPEKCQLMFIGVKYDIKLCININGIVVQMTDNVKLLDVTIDSMMYTLSAKKLQTKSELFLELLQTSNTKKTLCYIILLYYQILIIVHLSEYLVENRRTTKFMESINAP